MEVRSGTLTFEPDRDEGPRVEKAVFNFTSPVRDAVALLTGTSFGYSIEAELTIVNTRLSREIDDDVVTVVGTLGVRDEGDYDDVYEGGIQFLLLADLETEVVPSNLSITGVEHNQVTQFFRSSLDPATARADNAIGLIAGKNTILRVYVDTQTDPTRPTIASVSGTLEMRLPGSSRWISVTRLNGPIRPKQDSEIERRNADDTLNFFIPGVFSTGNVEFRVRVFDAAHPDQPGFTSGRVQRPLEFVDVAPLSVRGVGIHYTGMGLDIPAPDVQDLWTTLRFALKIFPVGRIVISGFDVIDYDGDFTDMSGDSCGSGWDRLLTILRLMQGDSDDVYFGLVPAGVPMGGFSGCGGGDGRVGAAGVGNGPVAAHEIAHAFGRRHAPCPPPGQTGSPANIDENYPTYDALPSGSIGEFGIDDLGVVKNPASSSDFMSYCGRKWTSPYTYEALLQNFLRS